MYLMLFSICEFGDDWSHFVSIITAEMVIKSISSCCTFQNMLLSLFFWWKYHSWIIVGQDFFWWKYHSWIIVGQDQGL